MYNAKKEKVYQATADALKNASSFREVTIPLSEVAEQFNELFAAANYWNAEKWDEQEKDEEESKPKNKGGRKPKAQA